MEAIASKAGRKEIAENILKGEGLKKTPELAKKFMEEIPIIEVPTKYVVFRPLKDVSEDGEPIVVVLVANSDQLSALVILWKEKSGRAFREIKSAIRSSSCARVGSV